MTFSCQQLGSQDRAQTLNRYRSYEHPIPDCWPVQVRGFGSEPRWCVCVCACQYSSATTKTCQGYPASLGHEAADAQQFAKWGVDYLK
jgi:hypothetical protein